MGVQSVDKMDKFTLLRWNALYNGVNLICDTAKERGLTDANANLKQAYLIKYIDEVTEKTKLY